MSGSSLFVATEFPVGLKKVSTLGRGKIASEWRPEPDGMVHAMAVDGPDLYVGGEFKTIAGAARAGIAKISVSGPGQLHVGWDPRPNGPIHAIELSNTSVYLGGTFGSVGGVARTHLAKVDKDANGSLDLEWNPHPDGTVWRIALWRDDLYITGLFFYVNGNFQSEGSVPRTWVAKVDANGTGQADLPWDARVSRNNFIDSETISALLPNEQGVLISFDPLQSFSLERPGHEEALGIIRFDNYSGSTDPSFPATVESQSEAQCIARQSDGRLIVGGNFSIANGLRRRNLLRLNQDGSIDREWNPSPDSAVLSIATVDDYVFIGGKIRTVGGIPRSSLVRLLANGPDSVDQSWNPPFFLLTSGISRLQIHNHYLYAGGFDRFLY